MIKKLFAKIKEAVFSVLPVSLIVLLLSFTPLFNITWSERIIFIISSFFLTLGIGLFSLGADIAMQPMGSQVGSSLMKTKKVLMILIACFILGVLITVAEPDLKILAEQVKAVVNNKPIILIIMVDLGVGIFLVLAVLKIILRKGLSFILMFFYLVTFSLIALLLEKGNGSFLALGMDSGGVTTGPITVPFLMALGVGIASVLGGRDSKENSFGLISMCSVGPIIAILLLGVFSNSDIDYAIPSNFYFSDNLGLSIFESLLENSKDVIIALALIVVVFFIIELIFIKLPKKKLLSIGIGILYTFLGLVIFLSAVSVGFMPIGFKLGTELANNKIALVIFGFVIGMVVVLAEPAVHVLTEQVEDVTMGGVSKKSMLIALSIGVGISICLSMLRIVFSFSLLYLIIPGYLLSLGLSFFVPKIYTSIAFDSGGVASGPLTSSFILPFAVGACSVILGVNEVLQFAYGIVAMVAMTPLITIQLLGFKDIAKKNLNVRSRMSRLNSSEDEVIIKF